MCECQCAACTCGTGFQVINASLYAWSNPYHDSECCHEMSVHDVTDYDMASDPSRVQLSPEQKDELKERRKHWWQRSRPKPA